MKPLFTTVVFFLISVSTFSQSPPTAEEDHSADLRTLLLSGVTLFADGKKDDLATLAADLAIPDHKAWFLRTYGDHFGPILSAEYDDILKELPMISMIFKEAHSLGCADVEVLRFAQPRDHDDMARDALLFMKARVPLYAAVMKKDLKDKRGVDVGFFAFIDGKHRLVGPLFAVAGAALDCRDQLHEIGLRLAMFQEEHQRQALSLAEIEEPAGTAFVCPCSEGGKSGYEYLYVVEESDAPEDALVAWDVAAHPSGHRVCLTFHGAIRELSEGKFEKALKKRYEEIAKALPKKLEECRKAVAEANGEAKKGLEAKLGVLEGLKKRIEEAGR